MIGLLIAQSAIASLQPYDGVGPTYDLECEAILADRTSRKFSVSFAGSGRERKATLEIAGSKFETRSYLTQIEPGADPGSKFDERVMIKESADGPIIMYRFHLPESGPRAFDDMIIFRVNAGQQAEYFGRGLCWSSKSEQ